jgi:thymidine phosphorylase
MTTITPAAALIQRKRVGQVLDARQLQTVADGIANGSWSEGQVGAFAMAVAWQGMSTVECREFTLAMRDSGQRLRWEHLPGPVVDKHSTGGVGDCVSLLLAPLLAACGAYVPMISGRGLGHTGGTLDKLESIPGYDVNPSLARLDKLMIEVGCAIIGQSADLVPADRRLYAVRDVTATVDVMDLIVPSILSKKLAGGARSLVLDIKIGNGAQTPDIRVAQALADRMLAVANGSGLTLRVALSDMDQVLGTEAGNALEVHAVLDLLCGRGGDARLRDLSLALAGELLCMSGLATDTADADKRLTSALASGAAAEKFAHMVAALGGPKDFVERAKAYLPVAPVQRVVLSDVAGCVAAMDVRALGNAIVELGGGRKVPGQTLDLAVGLSAIASRGQHVEAGDALAIIHARSESDADVAAASVRNAIIIDRESPPALPLYQWYSPAEAST